MSDQERKNEGPVGASAIEGIFPLTGLQEGIYFEYLAHLNAPRNSTELPPYNEQFICTIRGDLDPAILERAWNDLAARHSALRTAFTQAPGKGLLQIVLKARPVSFVFNNISENGDIEETCRTIAREYRSRPFDLARESLLRVCLLRTATANHRLIFTFHHLIADAWCGPILFEDLMALYASACGKDAALAPPPRSQFGDFARAQAKIRGPANLAFWRDYLDGMDEISALPFHDTNAAPGEFNTATHTLTPAAVARLGTLADRLGVPVTAILHAIWGWVLARLTDRGDILLAVVRANRPAELPDIERVIGMFIATVPLRINLAAANSLEEFFQRVHKDLQETAIRSAAPLAEILGAVGLDAGRIDHTVIGRNDILAGGDETSLDFPKAGLLLTDFVANSWDHYDFQIGFSHGRETRFEAKFREGRFDPVHVGQLLSIMGDALDLAVHQPSADPKIAKIFNKAHLAEAVLSGPRTEQIQDLLFKVVQMIAGKGASPVTVDDDETLSGAALLEAATATAHALSENHQVVPGDRVAILAEPGNDVIVGILAIWRLGATFVPFGADWPHQRVASVLADCGAKVILAPDSWQAGPEMVCPRLRALRLANGVTINPVTPDIAYIIYTSGSTGQPKGVKVGLEALSNYCGHAMATLGFGLEDAALQVSSPAFDLGYTTLFPVLLAGGTVNWTAGNRLVDPLAVVETLAARQVTVLKCTPSYLHLILSTPKPEVLSTLTHWRLLVLGGEAFDGGDLELLGEYCPWLQVVNHYGPTEATVGCAMAPLGDVRAASRGDRQIIGTPVANSRAHIRDRNGFDLPRGVVGELVIEGSALARGYVDGQPDGFHQAGDRRFYRTGDRARINEDGRLEYLGRADDMVKIRGFRVSPLETEIAIKQLPEVDDAAVVIERPEDGSGARLLAFVQPGVDSLEPRNVRARLAATLLSAQIPTRFHFVSRLVINQNGKVDRAAMLQHANLASNDKADHQPPSTATETKLAAIWARILKVEEISAADDFFAMGGHSLRALEVAAEIRREFKLDVSIKTFFKYPVLSGLARSLDLDSSPESAIIPLRRHPDGARILCLPPALGMGSVYKELIDTMALDTGVDAMDCPDADTNLESLEAMVAHMLDNLPDGGVGYDCLLGWSFGACLAIEMARQLEQRGQTVGLILLDGGPRQIFVSAGYDGVAAMSQKRYWSRVLEILKRTMTAAQLTGLEDTAARNKALWERYEVGLGLNADIFAVEAQTPRTIEARQGGMAGLKEFTQGQVQVIATTGDHYSMFHPPHLHQWICHAQIFIENKLF